jgi:hypothetical protein
MKEKRSNKKRSLARKVYPSAQHMLLKFLVSQPAYTLFALCVRESGKAIQFRQVKASFVGGTLSLPTRACHHHHSTRTSNDPLENHPDHGASSPQLGVPLILTVLSSKPLQKKAYQPR